MNKKTLLSLIFSAFILSTVFISCKGKAKGGGTLIIHESADPDMLNPINSSSANARTINELLFSQLTGGEVTGDFKLTPILTKELGKVSEIADGEFKGGMKVEYEIRPDAVWDNSTPITGNDYVFTIKTILNPKTNCEHLKSYYDWVGDIVVDETNPKKFTVYANKKYFKIEEFAGYYVLPEYNYDPQQIMRKFTIRDMNTNEKRAALKSNADIQKFAAEFNSEKFQRDPQFISGFGPYKLESWTTGQEVVLKKKDSWWGDKYASESRDFKAYPKKIKIKIITDANTGITALKDGNLDAYSYIPAKDYKELEKNETFKSNFDLRKFDRFSYSFLGMNLRNDKFKDLNVRKALAHAINRQKINEIISFGEAKLTETFAHPTQKTYNKTLTPFEYDVAKASSLLASAGWKDSDGDGTLDKIINGKNVPFTIELKYPKNETTKNMALIIQDDLKKVGIQVNIVEKEWTVYLQEQDKLQFEMFTGSFTIPERISDPKQIWHTTNAGPGGDNKPGWGNQASDKLIDDIISDLNEETRVKKYMELQKMIHDDVPVIFMFNGLNRMAISKKYDVESIMTYPGYKVQEFNLIK